MEINLESLLKLYGPLGMIFGFLLLVIWKKLLPSWERQQVENRKEREREREEYRKVLESTVADARGERDLMRGLREREVDKFLESLRLRDEKFELVADAISERRQTRQR